MIEEVVTNYLTNAIHHAQNEKVVAIRIIKEKEGERILKNIKDDAYVITLCIDGKQLNSEELSEKIEKLGIQGTSHIYFIIVTGEFEWLQN